MLFGVQLGLTGRDTGAALIHAGFGLLALLATGGLAGGGQGRRRAGWQCAAAEQL